MADVAAHHDPGQRQRDPCRWPARRRRAAACWRGGRDCASGRRPRTACRHPPRRRAPRDRPSAKACPPRRGSPGRAAEAAAACCRAAARGADSTQSRPTSRKRERAVEIGDVVDVDLRADLEQRIEGLQRGVEDHAGDDGIFVALERDVLLGAHRKQIVDEGAGIVLVVAGGDDADAGDIEEIADVARFEMGLGDREIRIGAR
jgi:hypothetical protein